MSDERLRPPRPHEKLTEDGRRVREVLTYARRGSRFTPKQRAAWEAHHEALADPRRGRGRAGLLAGVLVRPRGAAGRRDRVPAWGGDGGPGGGAPRPRRAGAGGRRPGVADAMGRVAAAGAANVRFCSVDAVWSLEHLVAPGLGARAVDVLPRPVAQEAAPQAPVGHAALRRAGGVPARAGRLWRLATDWADYAEQMLEVLDAEPPSRAASSTAGPTARSPSSSARASPPAVRSPT